MTLNFYFGNMLKVYTGLSLKQWQIWYLYELLLTMNEKSYMGTEQVYLHFTLVHFKGQGQGHAHFDNEYRRHSDRWDKN